MTRRSERESSGYFCEGIDHHVDDEIYCGPKRPPKLFKTSKSFFGEKWCIHEGDFFLGGGGVGVSGVYLVVGGFCESVFCCR